jgi:hypothetical protein
LVQPLVRILFIGGGSQQAKDPNYIAKLEKAITQKYGEEAINNPRRFWDEDKEKEYIQQSLEERQKFAKLSRPKTK